MYLYAEAYVSASRNFEGDDPDKFAMLLETFATDEAVKEAATSVDFPSARVVFTIAYWRKANQIHSWFVRECQEGRDECQKTYVGREKLAELREICLRILADKDEDLAEELLAPQGGFFFGSTEYNDWYWQDVRSTVKQLDRALAMPGSWDLYYRSSW